MINQLLTRTQAGEAVKIAFTKKDGTRSYAEVVDGGSYEPKTDRKKVAVKEGTTRLFCVSRGRFITVENSTVTIL